MPIDKPTPGGGWLTRIVDPPHEPPSLHVNGVEVGVLVACEWLVDGEVRLLRPSDGVGLPWPPVQVPAGVSIELPLGGGAWTITLSVMGYPAVTADGVASLDDVVRSEVGSLVGTACVVANGALIVELPAGAGPFFAVQGIWMESAASARGPELDFFTASWTLRVVLAEARA